MNANHGLLFGFGMLALASVSAIACSSTDAGPGGGAGAPPDSSSAGASGARDEPDSPSGGTAGAGNEPDSSAGAGGEGGAASGGAQPSSLTCMGMLRCAADCPDEDADACVTACLERTAESSQTVTAEFLQCLVDNECPDATCLQENCESELAACVADDTSAIDGTPTTEPAPDGAVPPELVGIWSSVGLSGGTSYEFEADGQTTQAFLIESSYGCTLKTELSSSGVTTVTGDLLVYHRTKGTLGTTTCGTVKTQPLEPADIAYRYALGTYEDGTDKLSLYRVNDDGSLSTSIDLHR